ncbi:sensor domain-containing diguanylate cyclase [Paucidesulfovibrio longus]|uniref:sensor domain-containing diguanylate cyclase n=1 Tax=Paucidesulfovibrio longus TaxID=889 RepID=UPI0003B3D2FA|nr:GGDEF domain-containing protein [Paucidesulfovibrio longus]
MNHEGRQETMWGLGLNDPEAARIQEAVGEGFELRNYPEGRAPLDEIAPEEQPGTTWIPWRIWESIPEQGKEAFREMEHTQRILIQDEDDRVMELDEVLEEGFLTAIRAPLTRDKVQDALFRAKEVTSLYSDIYRMTEEIILERELLKRKTDQLLFLNRFLTNATGSLDPAEILGQALDDLNLLLPVKLLQAAFWQRNAETGESEVELLLDARLGKDIEAKWIEFLLDTALRNEGGPIGGFQVEHMDTKGEPLPPEAGRSVILPLAGPQGQFGCLALLCDREIRLAKDQVQTLKSAVRHLGLALNNARLYREVKIRADRDGLTKLHNRQTFDRRLAVELKRSQRYGNSLALLMVDLDHFKQVNDTHGHAAGDMVLREVGALLQDSVRSCDIAARFGGEEFALLLPHTHEADAWKLADRIRRRIEKLRYNYAGKSLSITASIGVSSLAPGCLDKENDLLLRADQALYLAKANGRNTVATSAQCANSRSLSS